MSNLELFTYHGDDSLEALVNRASELEDLLLTPHNIENNPDSLERGLHEIESAYMACGHIKEGELPSFDELLEAIECSNFELIAEIAELELRENCKTCTERNACWGRGVTPFSADAADEESVSECQSETENMLYEFYYYNGDLCDTDIVVFRIVYKLGYAMEVEGNQVDRFYELRDDYLELYLGDDKKEGSVIFNDAQTTMFPSFHYDSHRFDGWTGDTPLMLSR